MQHICELQALATRKMGEADDWAVADLCGHRVECRAFRNPSIAFRKPIILFEYRIDGQDRFEIAVTELIRRLAR